MNAQDSEWRWRWLQVESILHSNCKMTSSTTDQYTSNSPAVALPTILLGDLTNGNTNTGPVPGF